MLIEKHGYNHTIGIFIFLLIIICSKILVGRIPHVICTLLLFTLLTRRIKCVESQLSQIAKGIIEYPSLIKIIDSIQFPEIFCELWGWYLLLSYSIHNYGMLSLADCALLSTLLSQLMFVLLVMIQQIFIAFLFTTCVGHGFFLFSVLPRLVAGARTLLTSFIWFDIIRKFDFFSPTLLIVVFIVFKGFFTLLWIYDLFSLLFSKDFPPEFKTEMNKEGFVCPVCMENVQFYITLPCTHKFCLSCFCRWGNIHLNCPVCRTDFSSWIHQVDFDNYLWFSLVIF